MKTIRPIVAISVVLLAFMGGCARQPVTEEGSLGALGYLDGAEERGGEAMAKMAPSRGAIEAQTAPSPTMQRQLTRRVSVVLESGDPRGLAEKAQGLTTVAGGHTESFGVVELDEGPRCNLVLRVPADQLDGTVAELLAMATRVRAENWTTDDVTSQVVDMSARVRALELTESELEKLLSESRASKFDAGGIMEIFRELSNVRSQREALQGSLAYLEDLVSLSTIDLVITPSIAFDRSGDSWLLSETVQKAFRSLVTAAQTLTRAIIYLVVVWLPMIAALGLLGIVVRGIWRRIPRKG